ncbi:MAG: NAD-dependent epimerase/dehydratase family protein [Caulobacterales bacterium]|uniref:NAD-dependent epimerase/dehydratase family protein n=1 Tax=Glycocaulis sp. TaxID=1969725 RepID=UPI003FA19057
MPDRVFITGAAGLVGQNLIPFLKAEGFEIVAADKHRDNLEILRQMHPDIEVIEADLAEPGPWQARLEDSDLAVLLHAQIGGLDADEFTRNNVIATGLCLEAIRTGRVRYTVHVSSSVVNSMADDFYTRSKGEQEEQVKASGIKCCILRPTLMFGWFDRKHLGWLKRFMEKAPVFPIPGHGRYLRQPLYGGDFSAIVGAALTREIEGTYNISGQETIDYIDLIRRVRSVNQLRTPIVKIPYFAFWTLLRVYALFDRNPPFTTHQLEALVTPDRFEVIDWPSIFGVPATPLDEALEQTYRHPVYSAITLKF